MVVRVICLAYLPILAWAQKIENLRHELFGNDIVLTYDLTNTLPSQQFLVKGVCQNGTQAIPLQSVEGNGLGRVRGGTNRQVVWRVLRDVPELVGEQITFTLTALLLENSEPQPLTRGAGGSSTSMADRKAMLFNDLTGQTDLYTEQVFNLAVAFQNYGARAFESRTDLLKLDQQVTRTNEAYEKLLQNKEPFKQQIRSLWGSEKLNADADQFFSRSLDQMHRAYLLPFNDTLKRINDVASGKLKPRDRNEQVNRIKIELDIRTSQLSKEIESVKGDAKRFYTNLQQ